MNISTAYKIVHDSGLYPPQLIQRTNRAIICEDFSLTREDTAIKTLALLGDKYICHKLTATKFEFSLRDEDENDQLELRTLADWHLAASVKIRALLLVENEEVADSLKADIQTLHKSITKLILSR